MAKKICTICNKRPVDKAAGIDDSCVPCYEEGGWENTHSDYAHEDLTAIAAKLAETGAVELRKIASQYHLVKNAGSHKAAELREKLAEAIEDEQAGCWICHPELNKAQKFRKEPGERPSRKGQKITVPLRAPGEIKAAVVVKAAPSAPIQVLTEKHGTVRLDLTTPTFVLILAWDAQGRYDYDRSAAAVGGKQKKVRNVAEALRLLAQVGIA